MICSFCSPFISYRNVVDCTAWWCIIFFLSEVPFTCSSSLQDGSTLSILMEYVHGGSLRKFINVYGSLTELLTAIYTEKILEGLAYLHERQYYYSTHFIFYYYVLGMRAPLICDVYGIERYTS